jgi:hypothetical protein
VREVDLRASTWLLVVVGCAPVEAVFVQEGDADADTDADSDSDSDSDPMPSRWRGEREVTFGDGCNGDLEEAGEDVSFDASWSDARASCGMCDQVFRLSVTPSSLCGTHPVQTEVLRGVQYDSDVDMQIWEVYFDGVWRAERLAYAHRSGVLYTYAYAGVQGDVGYEVTGFVELVE